MNVPNNRLSDLSLYDQVVEVLSRPPSFSSPPTKQLIFLEMINKNSHKTNLFLFAKNKIKYRIYKNTCHSLQNTKKINNDKKKTTTSIQRPTQIHKNILCISAWSSLVNVVDDFIRHFWNFVGKRFFVFFGHFHGEKMMFHHRKTFHHDAFLAIFCDNRTKHDPIVRQINWQISKIGQASFAKWFHVGTYPLAISFRTWSFGRYGCNSSRSM